ncbi:prepilin-type N-terminal cleavage/methylation domain-containing protein [Schinkia azotoformans]|uniref:prepilin-type N-terminal cleavage/methylation domain-containing protein n=1 Tax=Schinkia azotoformans TaxID=1454 RepID=UPI002E208A56|nr:prepilin-type N-terminal cleavage/methylation domain-containing protein [Schinkia azotoformans]
MFTIHSFKNKNGFTLLEVLLSLTLIFLIVFPLFRFFLQAYDYTMENRNKTIAVNIARNVVNYMEKQDIHVMKAFLEQDKYKNSREFARLNWTDCVIDKECINNPTTCKQSTISIDLANPENSKTNDATDENALPLFNNGANIANGVICRTVLRPYINDFQYDEEHISIFLLDYYDDKTTNEAIVKLLETEQDHTTLDTQINDKLTGSPQYESQLMKVYVVVNWSEKRDNIVLEGVISDEALR